MPWRHALALEHKERQTQSLWRRRLQLQSAQSTEIKRDNRTYLNFCSNDYLGLANHPKLKEAAVSATQHWGTGSGASHLVCGHQSSHHLLEEELADFVGAEQALLFSNGYMANMAIPQSFLGRGDLLIEDKLNHASLIDSAKLSRADFKRFKHTDVSQLETILNASAATRKLVSSDSVFSMDGDQASLTELNQLSKQHSAVLLIDDAHGFGVLGNSGRGSYCAASLAPTEHRLMLGTLGKAIGSFGAFVAGDSVYIEHLKQFARTYIYTTALPAAVAEASRAALKILKNEPWRHKQLQSNIAYLRNGINEIGLELMPSSTPIQPVLLYEQDRAIKASAILEEHGIWVSAIRPPTVPADTARLRITLNAEHTQSQLDQLLEGLKKVKATLT